MQTTSVISDLDLDEMQGLGFTREQIAILEEFLKPFAKTAVTYLVRFFVRARIRKKTFEESLAVVQKMRDDYWVHDTTDRVGDPDVVDGRGMTNTYAFTNLYKNLGLPYPKFLF